MVLYRGALGFVSNLCAGDFTFTLQILLPYADALPPPALPLLYPRAPAMPCHVRCLPALARLPAAPSYPPPPPL